MGIYQVRQNKFNTTVVISQVTTVKIWFLTILLSIANPIDSQASLYTK